MPNPLTHPAALTVATHLPHLGLLSIRSADNLKFLQGQFTCDVREVSPAQWRYGALCTNQGRMISNFILMQLDAQQHLLCLHRSTLTAVQNTLKKFAPFYKGALDDLSEQHQVIGLAGPDSVSQAAAWIGQNLDATHSMARNENSWALRLHTDRALLLVATEHAESVWSWLDTRAHTVEPEQWELLNIRAGLGEVRETTIEAWTPHMLNLQLIGAINFKKGCYTGQEIVARTEYRGQNKKAMYRIRGSGPLPSPGTDIEDHAQKAGELVMASPATPEHWEALAVINDKHLHAPLSCQGTAIELLDLPYTLPSKTEA